MTGFQRTLAAFLALLSLIGLALSTNSQTAAQAPTLTPAPTFAATRVPPDPLSYRWELIGDNFDRPVLVTAAGDDSRRLFVVEQGGTIMILKEGRMLPDPFLDVSTLITDDVMRGGYTERGLLGLVFSPDFRSSRVFYVNYVDQRNDTILVRMRVKNDNPDQADPASAVTLLTISHPFDNHNGGHLAFGKDGYLYMAPGDGGFDPAVGRGDPLNNSQNTSLLLGKMLRLDVSDLSASSYTIPPTNPYVNDSRFKPEIWAWGLRNPWRFSFDRFTGDLYIGDVGQWQWEEINFQPAGSPGGENYGWKLIEGLVPYEDAVIDPETAKTLTAPVWVYDHSLGCSVTGGYVYRGRALPALWGMYLYGDYCNGRVWTLYQNPDGTWVNTVFMDTGKQITSFGEDETGELYLVDYKGGVYKLIRK
ncbi:MAG: PQQ-dependent sugar dehydrogenase [Anaerolineae bacterium]|nr:PQQ-dependent sugar dehydrogenase [Anaerolineae bacterium]